jgi:hypothetical protein
MAIERQAAATDLRWGAVSCTCLRPSTAINGRQRSLPPKPYMWVCHIKFYVNSLEMLD